MKFKCRMGHVGSDPDFCRACLGSDFGVKPVEEPAAEAKPEERTPIIEPKYAVIKHSPADDVVTTEVSEGSFLPEAKHPSKHTPSHGKR